MKKIYLLAALLLSSGMAFAQSAVLDLSGTWRFQTDLMGFGKTPGSELYLARLTESIQLPGSTDEAGKGLKVNARHVDRLTRKFEYCGQAWYQREVTVPADWDGKEISLLLERCHWETTVYVDGQLAGMDEHLITPNRFVLTKFLTPGTHVITLCVDNRLKYPMDQWNHGTTEYTQTNWNGIVGKIQLEARDKVNISAFNAYPDIDQKKVLLKLSVANTTGAGQTGEVELVLREKSGKEVAAATVPVELTADGGEVQTELVLGNKMKLWDEFTPHLYEVTATLRSGELEDAKKLTFGMRKVEQGKHHIRVNNRNVHLRGTLDCCVFPLTGYPATTVDEWKRIFATVKEYGMNHVRFHSWCPPQAAFCAADELGIYLQAELPMWIKDVGKYPARRDFFEKELVAMLAEYGNHPSFILMCNGNENEGDFSVLEALIKKGQQLDNRHLYSASTARTHTPSDQYYTSHVSSKGWITVYEGQPSTEWDRSKESDIDCPVIAHETGQRCMFPNFDEMKKYTGVLTPANYEVFRERLARNGMLHQADDFFRATGMHTVLQYKEVNEALLRTANSGGFQLLGLSDFPGQGTALVGILDAFWESKGLVTPEKYRESCAPTVLLARLPKRAYTAGETFRARMEVYHYGQFPLKKGKLKWELKDESGKSLYTGSLSVPAVECATVDSLGAISVPLEGLDCAQKLTLHATLNGDFHNEWDIWVYPDTDEMATDGYLYARSYNDEVKAALAQGKKVLLVPEQMNGRKTTFAGHFWNPIMFNWAPMIVGTLIDDNHPAFHDFPTDSYADWQWWDILNYATAMPLDGLQGLTPVIQSIDSYENNQKLGVAFEARVGKGSLFVLNVDTEKDKSKRPAMRQLLRSVRQYVASDKFSPSVSVAPYQLDAVFSDKGQQESGASENAAVKQLLNQ